MSKIPKRTNKTLLTGKVRPKADNEPCCVICGKHILKERFDALLMLGKDRTEWTHTACSQESKIKGIYLGEAGTSQLQLVKKIYNDSVHDHFSVNTESQVIDEE